MFSDENFSKPQCRTCQQEKDHENKDFGFSKLRDEKRGGAKLTMEELNDEIDYVLNYEQRIKRLQRAYSPIRTYGEVKNRFAAQLDQYSYSSASKDSYQVKHADMFKFKGAGLSKLDDCVALDLSQPFSRPATEDLGHSKEHHSSCPRHKGSPAPSVREESESTSWQGGVVGGLSKTYSPAKSTRKHKPHCSRYVATPKWRKAGAPYGVYLNLQRCGRAALCGVIPSGQALNRSCLIITENAEMLRSVTQFPKLLGDGKTDTVQLLLLNKNGPFLTAKVVKARRVPSTATLNKSSQLRISATDSGISQDQLESEEEDESTPRQKKDVHTAITPKSVHSAKEPAKSRETSPVPESVVEAAPREDKWTQMTPKAPHADETSDWNTVATPSTASAHGPPRRVFRAKKRCSSSRISSCSSRNSGKSQFERWAGGDIQCYNVTTHYPNIAPHFAAPKERPIANKLQVRRPEKRGMSAEERNKMLKDALPSIHASTREESLQQLKQQVADYVTYLAVKSEQEAEPDTKPEAEKSKEAHTTDDEVEVHESSSRLIRALTDPLQHLTSDVAAAVTRSVTDAVVGADAALVPPNPDNALKLSEQCIAQVKEDMDLLFDLVRKITSSVSLNARL